jgi:hypothetical protein
MWPCAGAEGGQPGGVAVTEEPASAAVRIGHEQEGEEGKEQLAVAFN